MTTDEMLKVQDVHDDLMAQIERLRTQLFDQRCPVDVRGTIRECIASGQCGCTNGLFLPAPTGDRRDG